ncbi:MAG: sulfatase [Prolixibacteraceae bacterium]|jgi:arylsulfatase A-like enzyme|nr:sulfatase [Prolixibacteraceae bacterium]
MNKLNTKILPLGMAFAGMFPLVQTTAAGKIQAKRPNVVFILADDLGWSDLACYGSRFYETPRIDQLAKEGVRFSNAYAACHVCSPTRASILTGQYPARLGLTDWLPGRKNFPFQKLKNVASVQRLPYGENTTFPAVMQANGYKTAIIGKWHLGEDSASCERQGFDLHIPSGWMKGWPAKGYFSPYRMPGLKDGPEGEYLTDRMTDEAIRFITENKDCPFLLYLSHYAVHDPIQGRPDLVKKYQQKLKQMPSWEGVPYILEGNPDSGNPLSKEELSALLQEKPYEGFSVLPNRTVKIKQNQDNVQFAAMIESLDESVGRVLDKLKELGLEDNTIIIFFSDNGGMSAANFGNPTRVVQADALDKSFSTSNLPLRAGKGWLYEGGIRVPMIVKWPQKGNTGAESNVPVISADFYPTILDILGLSSGKHVTDGISLVPLLKKQDTAPEEILYRPIFWHFPHYSNHGMQSPGGAVRYGDYKLIEYFENNTVQLFNLSSDPGEQADLSQIQPEKTKELRKILHQWRKEINAQTMEPNPEYIPAK